MVALFNKECVYSVNNLTRLPLIPSVLSFTYSLFSRSHLHPFSLLPPSIPSFSSLPPSLLQSPSLHPFSLRFPTIPSLLPLPPSLLSQVSLHPFSTPPPSIPSLSILPPSLLPLRSSFHPFSTLLPSHLHPTSILPPHAFLPPILLHLLSIPSPPHSPPLPFPPLACIQTSLEMIPIRLALLDKTKENSLTCARLTEMMMVRLRQCPTNIPNTATVKTNCSTQNIYRRN